MPLTPKASHYCHYTMIIQTDFLKMRAACRSFSPHELTPDIFYRIYENFNVRQFLINLETNLLLKNHC